MGTGDDCGRATVDPLGEEGSDAGRALTGPAPPDTGATAARRRAAVELIAQHGSALRHTARRYSLCAADAEDAYQRTLEIVLCKAPLERGRDLVAWSKTVAKHEALAIARNRERLLGRPVGSGEDDRDPVSLIPSREEGPPEQLERREEMARSREALQALKPAELRALTLLAQGYSYAEIGAITGFSRTKVNRCLAEGRERFRSFLAHSEDGSRCREMATLLSPFCDGETSAEQTAAVREHLRACATCRAAVRAYRAAPARVAALAPLLPASRSLLERMQELLLGVQSRVPGLGGGGDASATQVTVAGGARGAGAAALAKVLAVCAGTVGGTAACVAAGVAPAPAELARDPVAQPRIERVSEEVVEVTAPTPPPPIEEGASAEAGATAPAAKPEATVESESGAVEYPEEAPAPASPTPAPPPPAPEPIPTSGSAAGEFGP